MDRDGLDAHFVAGAMDAQRDFAAVGDQQFLDRHRSGLADDDERLVELDRLGVADQDLA